MKLQYPIYVSDIDPDAHIKVFKNVIKANGETMEVDISTYLVLLLGIISLNGVKNMFKTIQIALLKSWNKHFASNSKL
jgi:hypothetical protein